MPEDLEVLVANLTDILCQFNTMQRTATHHNVLQHTATHCQTLQHTHIQAAKTATRATVDLEVLCAELAHSNTLQNTAKHCNTHTSRR